MDRHGIPHINFACVELVSINMFFRICEVIRGRRIQVNPLPVQFIVNKKDLRNCTLISGFHGIGETGYIAVSYLVHALSAERIGFVKVAYPPPFIATSEDGIVTPFEVYKKGNIVIVKLEFTPHRSEEAEFSKTLASWAVKEKFRDAVLVGGLDSTFRSGEGDYRIVPTRTYLVKSKKFSAATLDPGLFVYGPLAVALSEFEINSFPAVAVLPYATAARADPGAAAVAIRSICKAYSLKVNVSDLEKDAKEIEEEIDRRLKQTKESLRTMYV
jgi:predicted ATP-grasp superfamily ATP-dependent carboligase